MNNLQSKSILFNKKPKKLVFLLHGYGDNAENFIPIANYLNNENLNINFFAPNAPSSLPQYPIGRQWFDLYPNEIHYSQAGPQEKQIMEKDCLCSIKKLQKFINQKCNTYNLSTKDCFLVGFSQGAMIAYELGGFANNIFAGCVMISGRVLSKNTSKQNLFIKTPLLILHGNNDELVNPIYFKESCKITKSKGFYVEHYLVKGVGHTISNEMLLLVYNFIKKFM